MAFSDDVIRGFLEHQVSSGGILSQERARREKQQQTRLELTMLSRKLEMEFEKHKAEQTFDQDLTRVRPGLTSAIPGVPQGFDDGGQGLTTQEVSAIRPQTLRSSGQSMHPIPLSSPEVGELAKMYGVENPMALFSPQEQKQGWVPKARIDSLRYNRPKQFADLATGRTATMTGNTVVANVPGSADFQKRQSELQRAQALIMDLEETFARTPKGRVVGNAAQLVNAVTGWFPEVTKYNNLQDAMGVIIQKGVLGEVGNLTEQERSAGKRLAGKTSYTEEEHRLAMELLRKILRVETDKSQSRLNNDMFGRQQLDTQPQEAEFTQEDTDLLEEFDSMQ